MATRTSTVQISMPQMGESVTEGTVLGWLKAVGDRVEADEPLVEVSTDKVDAEVPAPAAGTIAKIHVSEGDTVQVGQLLAEITTNGAEAAPATQRATEVQAEGVDPVPGTPAQELTQQAAGWVAGRRRGQLPPQRLLHANRQDVTP